MSYLLDAADALPEQTLGEVMHEIAESRERARMICTDELRARAKRRVSELYSAFPDNPADYTRGKRDAYSTVLRWLDELEGRD